MLYTIFLVIDVLLAVALVILVLLHRGRGSEVGAAFAGGGASGSVFGARGASSFMTRLITVLSVLFLVNSLFLAYIANRDFSERPLIDQVEEAVQQAEEQEAAEADADADVDADAADSDDAVPEIPN